ncbi:hypothetical protein CHS0354_016795 [Potamilus streckersoni]|uniref:Uncharacterized protein n=1 Tax=Potamilus streckersoni TaxID=2493646 RepID=A0AAE0T471_9BIVA|nr:hypothetical protein CHS0354_016795 [Potamilus streckersoni]
MVLGQPASQPAKGIDRHYSPTFQFDSPWATQVRAIDQNLCIGFKGTSVQYWLCSTNFNVTEADTMDEKKNAFHGQWTRQDVYFGRGLPFTRSARVMYVLVICAWHNTSSSEPIL